MEERATEARHACMAAHALRYGPSQEAVLTQLAAQGNCKDCWGLGQACILRARLQGYRQLHFLEGRAPAAANERLC